MVIAGAVRRRLPSRLLRNLRTLAASLTGKLVLLVAVFIALPIFLYFQMESGDLKLKALVTKGIEQRNTLIAAALTPVLEEAKGMPTPALKRELARRAEDGTHLKLLFRRPVPTGDADFYYVASVPPSEPARSDREFERLKQHAMLPRLARGCSDPQGGAEHSEVDSKEEMLTSVVPVQTGAGCWALVISHSTAEFLDTSIGRPYWQSPEVSFAAMIYLALAFIMLLTALSVWRSIRTFGSVARQIRRGRDRGQTFASRNVVPEFASIAEDFDGLVEALHGAARDLRQSAEENAHSFKGPIATIGAALGALARSLPAPDQRQQQILNLINGSLRRLTALVFASQRIEELNADLLDAPRTRVNLTALIADVLLRYAELCANREIKLARHLDEDVFVRASEEPLAEAIENILDNAVSFAPPQSLIDIRLSKRPGAVELVVQDEGPGIEPDKIDHVFERYFSLRAVEEGETRTASFSAHAGLGLWIVKRNIEAIGGEVRALNRSAGGLMICASLPAEP